MTDDKKPNIFKTAAESIKTRLKVAGIIPSSAKWCPVSPSRKQKYILEKGFEEMLFGGSVGGGKTLALIMGALEHVDDPQYRAIIFRVNYTAIEEPQGLKDQLDDLLKGTKAVWSERKKEYKFPSGARLRFGSLVNKEQLKTYQGGGYHFCVGEGTPVLLADGNYKPIERLAVGDELMTLEGPRKVTRVFPTRKDEAVEAAVYDSNGGFIEKQIQSANHEVLSAFGWISYANALPVFCRPVVSIPIQNHSACRLFLSNAEIARFVSRVELSRCSNPAQPFLLSRLFQSRQDYAEISFSSGGNQNDSVGFGDVPLNVEPPVLSFYREEPPGLLLQSERDGDSIDGRSAYEALSVVCLELRRLLYSFFFPELLEPASRSARDALLYDQSACKESSGKFLKAEPPFSLCFPVTLHEPALPLNKSSLQEHAYEYGRAYPLSQDFPGDYLGGSRFYDGQLPSRLSNGQVYPPSPVDAEVYARYHNKPDDSDSIPRRTLHRLDTYVHPYTRELRALPRNVGVGTCYLSPVGQRILYDITVEDVSHYITSSKLINKNCGIDQLEQIPEYFYRFIFSRARRTKKTKIPVRVWATANASETAQWIKKHFIEGTVAVDDGLALIKEHSNDLGWKWESAYVPAGLADNPGIDTQDYLRKLARLTIFERKQLLEGDWDVTPEGDVYPFLEQYSVITRSVFRRFYGIQKDKALVPRNFELGNSLDWGSSQNHVTGDCYIARPPKDGLLSDSLFIFRENVFLQPIEKDVADWKQLNEREEESRRYIWRILSHEAKTERDTLLRQYNFHFTPSSGHRTEGISAVRDHIVLIDTDKPHPFHSVLYGRPRLFLVVDDDQGELIRNDYARDEHDRYCVTPPRDHGGLIECRQGLKRYKWGENGQPDRVRDDMADAIRFLVVKMTRFPKYIAADPKDKSLPVNLQMPSIAAATPAEQPDLYLQRRIELAIVEKIRRQQTKKNERVPVWQRRFFGG